MTPDRCFPPGPPVRVSRSAGESLVLGTWGIAGPYSADNQPCGYGAVDETAARAVLDAAWVRGIRQVDTTSSYGGGEGWSRLRAWEELSGERFQLTIKVGRPLVDGRPVSRLDLPSIGAEIADARATFGRSPHVVLIKDPTLAWFMTDAEATWSQLQCLEPRATLGVATHLHEARDHLSSTNGRRIAQIEYHGINRRAAARTAANLSGKGWSVWAMQPLAYGFLARDGDQQRQAFGADDWRVRLSPESCAGFARHAAAFHAGFAFGQTTYTKAAVALAFVLSDPHVDRVVVGPKAPSQFDDVDAALVLCQDDEFVDRCHALRTGPEGVWRGAA